MYAANSSVSVKIPTFILYDFKGLIFIYNYPQHIMWRKELSVLYYQYNFQNDFLSYVSIQFQSAHSVRF